MNDRASYQAKLACLVNVSEPPVRAGSIRLVIDTLWRLFMASFDPLCKDISRLCSKCYTWSCIIALSTMCVQGSNWLKRCTAAAAKQVYLRVLNGASIRAT